jgi:hypothetical protein
MSRAFKYFILTGLCLPLLACLDNHKQLNRRVTLWRKDKIPYGTYYAYESLKYLFPDAAITINKTSPADYRFEAGSNFFHNNRKHRIAYIIIAPQVIPDRREIDAMMNFVGNGNQIFISAIYMGDSLLDELKLSTRNGFEFFNYQDSLSLSLYNPVNYDSLSFQYPGLRGDNSINIMDSMYTSVLGRDSRGHPNFVKFGYKGGGAIYLHFAPMAMTNFFLLHRQNSSYYDNVLSYIPSTSILEVKWDDYFRYPRNSTFSSLEYILGNQALRWAFWLTVLLFLLIYLFESKRSQRMIQASVAKTNSSLDFVKTIGRLYYQRKDNANLAGKMITHFLDHIRSKYNIQTSSMDDEFRERLSYKSGAGREQTEAIVSSIRSLQGDPYPTDEDLLSFNKKIEEFS